MNEAAAVRSRILDALRLDLVGPRPGEPGNDAYTEEVLPSAPSNWYLTGFLVDRIKQNPGCVTQRACDQQQSLWLSEMLLAVGLTCFNGPAGRTQW